MTTLKPLGQFDQTEINAKAEAARSEQTPRTDAWQRDYVFSQDKPTGSGTAYADAFFDCLKWANQLERELAVVNAKAEALRLEGMERLYPLLMAANCPQCDDSGSWADPSDGSQMQCQWCFERESIRAEIERRCKSLMK